MANIKFRFISGKDIVSSLIELFEGGSQFSHVEFVFDDAEQQALGLAGPYVGAHADKGIEAYDDAYYAKPANTFTRQRAYSLEVTDEQYAAITSFIKARVGTPYDFKDIAGIMFHQGWHTANRYICSAFVIAALWAGDVRLLNVLPGYQYKVTPETAHLSPLLIGRQITLKEG